MSGLSSAGARIGDKIVDILFIFDLSFFISGAVGVAAFLQFRSPKAGVLEVVDGASAAGMFALVLGSYALGLICFAIGRPLRKLLEGSPLADSLRKAQRWVLSTLRIQAASAGGSPRSTDQALRDLMRAHGLIDAEGREASAEPLLGTYFGYDPTRPDFSSLYTRMWAHVRSFSSLGESFSLLNRYWVLSASYDGVGVAVMMWLLPLWGPLLDKPGAQQGSDWAVAVGLSLATFVATYYCWRRAREYKRYQVEELVATVAHWLTLVGRAERHRLEHPSAGDDEAGDEAPAGA